MSAKLQYHDTNIPGKPYHSEHLCLGNFTGFSWHYPHNCLIWYNVIGTEGNVCPPHDITYETGILLLEFFFHLSMSLFGTCYMIKFLSAVFSLAGKVLSIPESSFATDDYRTPNRSSMKASFWKSWQLLSCDYNASNFCNTDFIFFSCMAVISLGGAVVVQRSIDSNNQLVSVNN